MNSILFILACAGILMPAQADAAAVRAALLITATTVSTVTPADDSSLAGIDADSFEMKDLERLPHFMPSGADQPQYGGEAGFSRRLFEHLQQLSIPAHTPYFISIEAPEEKSTPPATATISLRY